MNTYRKTKSGEWVVCGPSSAVCKGATVTVTKRDGTTKTEHIERTGRPFSTPEGEKVYGYIAQREAPSQRGSTSRQQNNNGCPRCCYIPGQRTAQIWEDCESCGTEPIYV